MNKKIYLAVCGLVLFLVAACSQPVLKQDIPVTTNPRGAKIYANGQLVGTTPASVGLERNRDHILTLIKENYRQEDVVISRQYQKEKVYLKAIQSGINSGLFFKDARMGVGSSMSSLSSQEDTGEAYVLAPPAIKVTLTPAAGFAPTTSGQSPASAAAKPDEIVAADSAESALNKEEMAKGLLKIGATEALTQAKPLEKKTEVSSSSRSYVQSDGTKVTEKSSTSVGVSVNPAALIGVLDTLFK
jgi:hypothetical protein